MMGAVFAMQGLGQLTAAFVMLFVTLGFKESLETSTKTANCTGVCAIAVDKMWRTLIGFGAVPGCIALYYRLTIPETPRYTFDVARDVEKADDDVKAYMSGKREGHPDEATRVAAQQVASEQLAVNKASWSDFVHHYSQLKHAKVLAGWVFLSFFLFFFFFLFSFFLLFLLFLFFFFLLLSTPFSLSL